MPAPFGSTGQPSVASDPEIICEGGCRGCHYAKGEDARLCPKNRFKHEGLKVIPVDLSEDTLRTASERIDIAKEVARAEDSRVPEGI